MSDWGYNSTLGYSTVGAGSYTTVSNVKDWDAQKVKRKKIDTTHLASSANTMTSRAGMVDPDAIKVSLQYDKTQHNTLLGFAVASSPNKDWKFTLSDGSTAVFTGYIAEFDPVPKAVVDDIYYNEMSLQPVGAITFTAAS